MRITQGRWKTRRSEFRWHGKLNWIFHTQDVVCCQLFSDIGSFWNVENVRKIYRWKVERKVFIFQSVSLLSHCELRIKDAFNNSAKRLYDLTQAAPATQNFSPFLNLKLFCKWKSNEKTGSLLNFWIQQWKQFFSCVTLGVYWVVCVRRPHQNFFLVAQTCMGRLGIGTKRNTKFHFRNLIINNVNYTRLNSSVMVAVTANLQSSADSMESLLKATETAK